MNIFDGIGQGKDPNKYGILVIPQKFYFCAQVIDSFPASQDRCLVLAIHSKDVRIDPNVLVRVSVNCDRLVNLGSKCERQLHRWISFLTHRCVCEIIFNAS